MAALSDLDLSKMEDVKQSVTCGICLQIFNDPRALSCSHTYCLICLQGFQTSSSKKKNCPECRKDSIPVKQDLAGLPVNQLAVKLVDLVHKYDPESKEEAPQWREPKPNSTGEEEQDSDSSSDDDDDDGDLETRLSALLRINSEVGGLAQMLGLMSGLRDDDDEDESRGVCHGGVRCDCCEDRVYGSRYKCGMCDDFDLCEDCFHKPRTESHNTDTPHVFVKLRKPRTSVPAYTPVLKDDSFTMAMTMDVSKTEHMLYVSEAETKFIKCGNCNAEPISGVRFKCGVCADYDLCEECEAISPDIHDHEHPFIVFKHPVAFHTIVPQLDYDFYQ